MKITAKKFVLCFMAAGFLLPVAYFVFYWAFGHTDVFAWLMQTQWCYDGLLMFWPSSILLTCCTEGVTLPILATTLNVILYGVLGWVLWIGLKRSRIVLIVTVVSILAGWYGLLRL